MGEMLVTSTPKVRLPGAADFIGVLPSKTQRGRQALLRQSPVLRDFDGRVEPELRFPRGVLYVHMRPILTPSPEGRSGSWRKILPRRVVCLACRLSDRGAGVPPEGEVSGTWPLSRPHIPTPPRPH